MDRRRKRWHRTSLLLWMACSVAAPRLEAQGGGLDPSFWDEGTFGGPPDAFGIDPREDGLLAGIDDEDLAFLIDDHAGAGFTLPGVLHPRTVLALPGGKILVTLENDFDESLGSIELVRLNRDLTLDSTFAGGGRVTVPPGPSATLGGSRTATGPDGSIFLAWRSGGGMTVDKRRADGSAIAGDGFPAEVLGPEQFGAPQSTSGPIALLVQLDGKPVVFGSFYDSVVFWEAVRFSPTGTRDSSFGDGGVAEVRLAQWIHFSDAGLAADGGLYLTGTANYGEASNAFGLLAKLDAAGALDEEFGSAGLRTFTFGGSHLSVRALLVVPGFPEWLLVGGADFGSGGAAAPVYATVMAFDANGEVRSEFGDGGRKNLDLPPIPGTPDRDFVLDLRPHGELLDRAIVVTQHTPAAEFPDYYPQIYRAARIFLY